MSTKKRTFTGAQKSKDSGMLSLYHYAALDHQYHDDASPGQLIREVRRQRKKARKLQEVTKKDVDDVIAQLRREDSIGYHERMIVYTQELQDKGGIGLLHEMQNAVPPRLQRENSWPDRFEVDLFEDSDGVRRIEYCEPEMKTWNMDMSSPTIHSMFTLFRIVGIRARVMAVTDKPTSIDSFTTVRSQPDRRGSVYDGSKSTALSAPHANAAGHVGHAHGTGTRDSHLTRQGVDSGRNGPDVATQVRGGH